MRFFNRIPYYITIGLGWGLLFLLAIGLIASPHNLLSVVIGCILLLVVLGSGLLLLIREILYWTKKADLGIGEDDRTNQS